MRAAMLPFLDLPVVPPTSAKQTRDEREEASKARPRRRTTPYSELVEEIANNVRDDYISSDIDCLKGYEPLPKNAFGWESPAYSKERQKRNEVARGVDALFREQVLEALETRGAGLFQPGVAHIKVTVERVRSDELLTKGLAGALFASRLFGTQRNQRNEIVNPFDFSAAARNPEAEAAGNFMIANYKDLLVEFAKNAFECTSEGLHRHRGRFEAVELALSLQFTDRNYNPVAGEIHMDNLAGFGLPCVTTRYGVPAEEQPIKSLLMSFCADQNPADGPRLRSWWDRWMGRTAPVTPDVFLYSCGTRYFGGVPVVATAALLEIVANVRSKNAAQFSAYSDREMLNYVARYFNEATREALAGRSSEELGMLVPHETGSREWSNANALAFHKSPGKQEVLEHRQVEDASVPRMRGICAMTADGRLSFTGAPFSHRFEVQGGVRDPRNPNRTIKLTVFLTVS
jgi:hypothetical protein